MARVHVGLNLEDESGEFFVRRLDDDLAGKSWLRRRRETPTADPPERPDPAPAADQVMVTAELSVRVEAAVAALPERQREAVVLCHYQELSNIEAAALMGVSIEALESLLARGRRSLRTVLADLARSKA